MNYPELFKRALTAQSRVVRALILRDMRTRFGRTFFGYVISVLWPLSHLATMMCVYLLARRLAPFGTSSSVFLATGILPYILCLYPARMIALSLVQNKPLLYFPVVKSFDVVLARGILEIVTAFWVVTLFSASLFVFGVDVTPVFPEEAIGAIFATIFLGFSIGFFSAVLYSVMRAWIVFMIVALMVMYFASGALVIPSALSRNMQYYMSFNPLFHAVEWLRSAYYDGYGYGLISKTYLLSFSATLLFMALLAERFIRQFVLK